MRFHKGDIISGATEAYHTGAPHDETNWSGAEVTGVIPDTALLFPGYIDVISQNGTRGLFKESELYK